MLSDDSDTDSELDWNLQTWCTQPEYQLTQVSESPG